MPKIDIKSTTGPVPPVHDQQPRTEKKEPREAAPPRLDTISNISQPQTAKKTRPRLRKQAAKRVEKMA